MSLFKLILESSLIPVTDAIIHTVYQVLGRVGRDLRQVKNRVQGKKDIKMSENKLQDSKIMI